MDRRLCGDNIVVPKNLTPRAVRKFLLHNRKALFQKAFIDDDPETEWLFRLLDGKYRSEPPPRDSVNAAMVREAFHYDPETGVFTWREGRKRKGAAGFPRTAGYWGLKLGQHLFAAHRVAWLYVHGEWPRYDIDHIDGDRRNNRISNLRDVTTSVNGQNQRKATASSQTRLLGCHPHRHKFQAQITLDGSIKHLGVFDTAEQGHQAYLLAKRQLHVGCTI